MRNFLIMMVVIGIAIGMVISLAVAAIIWGLS